MKTYPEILNLFERANNAFLKTDQSLFRYQVSEQTLCGGLMLHLNTFAETLLNRHKSDQTDYTKKYEEIIGEIQVSDPAPLKTAALAPPKPFDNDKLISDLKAFRLKRSREENIKPYFIFNDAQMMDLISKMPDSKEAMLSVAGFGQAKVNKYGEAILEILSKFVG